ncbi:thiolase family protein [Candidatus Thalassarchaeum betae]|uniref:thiolase family protein n=1 Tax=Candidatus Thalassarchaeum betae TaxID=2599289 RepID=UPI0030C707C7|nr:thiolase family protein [Candidatus Thalassoarchaea betae]
MKAVIIDWARSPFDRAHKGGLAGVRPDDMAGQVAKALIDRSGIDPVAFDDLLMGCGYPEAEQGYNIARLVTFLAGMPDTVPGVTFNRLCGSSMQAVLSAAAQIEAGWGGCFLCVGAESMTRVKRRGFNWSPHPGLEEDWPEAYVTMGQTAENVAARWSITRDQQERFALASHQKAATARESGSFDAEIIPLSNGDNTVSEDGCIRPGTTLEAMAELVPVFSDGGTVTAATSSPLTDGAVAMIVCSEEFASDHGLEPMARIISGAVTGCPPEIMGIGPVEATRKVLERTGWDIDSIDIFELNEAFSSQSLAVIDELGLDPSKVNLEGGALAIGHPLGASGARITGKAASLLARAGSSRAIATMCIGGGMGIAIALENS